MAENQHYISRAHLKRFVDSDGKLYELHKAKDHIQHRSLKSAGAKIDIYPPHVERGIMQKYDNEAHSVIKGTIIDQGLLALTEAEKSVIEHWLMMFIIRVPSQQVRCESQVVNEYHREDHIQRIMTQQHQLIKGYRRTKPEKYKALLERIGSRKRAHEILIQGMIEYVESGEAQTLLSPQMLFEHMLTSDSHKMYARQIHGMNWRWIRSMDEFVIGDNPVCRTQFGQTHLGYDYGFARPDAIITFPMTKNLCLRLDRSADQWVELEADAALTQHLNRLQIVSASELAWGPSIHALRPDMDETEIM